MPFLSAYVPVLIEPDGTYRLTAHVVYKGRDDVFTVPAGFVTDLASVPRLMSWLVPIAGAHDRAAILHDFCCTQLEAGDLRLSAPDVDGLFRRCLRELGVPLVRRWLFYAGVRWGALGTPARRPGWWSTAPVVLGVSLLALPFLLPAALFVGLALLIDRAVEAVK